MPTSVKMRSRKLCVDVAPHGIHIDIDIYIYMYMHVRVLHELGNVQERSGKSWRRNLMTLVLMQQLNNRSDPINSEASRAKFIELVDEVWVDDGGMKRVVVRRGVELELGGRPWRRAAGRTGRVRIMMMVGSDGGRV